MAVAHKKEGKIILRIQASNIDQEDQIVNCNINWTVGELKQYLRNNVPGGDLIGNQQHIVNGKYISDSEPITSIYKISDEPQTVTMFVTDRFKRQRKEKLQNQIKQASLYDAHYPEPPDFSRGEWTPDRIANYFQQFSYQMSRRYQEHMSAYLQHNLAIYATGVERRKKIKQLSKEQRALEEAKVDDSVKGNDRNDGVNLAELME